MRNLARALLLLSLYAAAASGAQPIEVTDAWIRATPPGARTAAAYLTLTNRGPAEQLVGAASPAARELEIHTHVSDGGLQRMVRLAELALPQGTTVQLEPGGLHLMLIDLAAPLVPGTHVELTLRFAGTAPIAVTAPVVDARAAATPPRHDGH